LSKNVIPFSTTVRTSNVVPDFVQSSKAYIFENKDTYVTATFPNGNFIEAKTSQNVTNSGSTDNQIFGMIDALSMELSSDRTRKAVDVYAASLYLVTPAGTKISNDIIVYAKAKHVNLFHFTAEYNRDNPNQIRLGPGRQLHGYGTISAPNRTGTLEYDP
jgi:hypothetical protein